MPKMKTKKAAAKRFRKTPSGKLRRSCAGKGHLLSGKSSKQKRRLRKGALVSSAQRRQIAKMF